MKNIDKLRASFPFPDVDNIEKFIFELDGGGREIIEDLIQSFFRPVVIIEIGCFLCGSSYRWLNLRDEDIVIGIDPWEGDFGAAINRYKEAIWADKVFKAVSDRDKLIADIKKEGNFAVACAAVKDFPTRFIPVKKFSPQALFDLKAMEIEPDIIYVDSVKHEEDLIVANDLFPNAILCGDDWTWGAEQGFPMRTAVTHFSELRGFEITVDKATWLLIKPEL